jgi:hypothetical protein
MSTSRFVSIAALVVVCSWTVGYLLGLATLRSVGPRQRTDRAHVVYTTAGTQTGEAASIVLSPR